MSLSQRFIKHRTHGKIGLISLTTLHVSFMVNGIELHIWLTTNRCKDVGNIKVPPIPTLLTKHDKAIWQKVHIRNQFLGYATFHSITKQDLSQPFLQNFPPTQYRNSFMTSTYRRL